MKFVPEQVVVVLDNLDFTHGARPTWARAGDLAVVDLTKSCRVTTGCTMPDDRFCTHQEIRVRGTDAWR